MQAPKLRERLLEILYQNATWCIVTVNVRIEYGESGEEQ